MKVALLHDFSLVPDLNNSESEMILMQKQSLKTSPGIEISIWKAGQRWSAKAHG